ncbi:MAG: hypothetical protein IPK12_07175 [Gemmatimonadetes bacterium]|nr:hypothetical protein [Gemmatimonadota bacterium]
MWMLDQFKLNALEAKDDALFLPDYDFVPANGHLPGYESYVVDIDKRTFAAFPHRIAAIAGISAIPRVHSQRGVFTIHRDPSFLAETDPVLSECFCKVVIPRDLVTQAQRFLTVANVHSFSVFPDLSGLGRYLRRCVLGKAGDGLL